MRTQIGIIGAGPAGLVLSHLLHLEGVESVVLEARSRAYVEQRVRAGVLEQNTVDLLVETGVGDRMLREGSVHHGVQFSFRGQRHRIDLRELTNRAITLYAQQEVVRDLIAARLAAGGQILFDVSGVSLDAIDSTRPIVHFEQDGQARQLECDFIAGCDGFHGVSRNAIPQDAISFYEREYPFAWLGVLVEAAPTSREIVYTHHERGFALFSMRSPRITRLYLQCGPDDDISQWPNSRIWEELHTRLNTSDGWKPAEGPILQKAVTSMRSFVSEPMQYGRLYLAGDAAHIVPPTGAKGLNLAIADVRVLSRAFIEFYAHDRKGPLDHYSETCLRRVWKVQRFSSWMTTMWHRFNLEDGFEHRRQLAELDYVTSSRAGAAALAENYVGLPMEDGRFAARTSNIVR